MPRVDASFGACCTDGRLWSSVCVCGLSVKRSIRVIAFPAAVWRRGGRPRGRGCLIVISRASSDGRSWFRVSTTGKSVRFVCVSPSDVAWASVCWLVAWVSLASDAGDCARALVACARSLGYLVDPASSHMLVSKIKPCMSKYKRLYCETANGSLNQLWFI